jgi:hypothetical protein
MHTYYKYVDFFENDSSIIMTKKREEQIIKALTKLIKKCEIIQMNSGYMIKDEFKIGDSLRGPTLQYSNGNFDYYYNIENGWMIDKSWNKKHKNKV